MGEVAEAAIEMEALLCDIIELECPSRMKILPDEVLVTIESYSTFSGICTLLGLALGLERNDDFCTQIYAERISEQPMGIMTYVPSLSHF